jgi:hypothetical protein
MVRTSAQGHPVVFLHVGAMKTGTTFLQQLMFANRDLLADAGVFLPGDSWTHQLRAAQDLLGRGRLDRHVREASAGAWGQLAAEIRRTALPVAVVSVEFLGTADRHQIRRVLDSLAPAEVRVIFTVRDMGAVLPALWQTQVHNGATYDWLEFLRRIDRPSPVPRLLQPHRPEDVFRVTQDVPGMLARWSSALAPQRLHVVTVPSGATDPTELWRRFAGVIGVDPAVAARPSPSSNASIGLPATELIRALNRHIGRLRQSEYNVTVKDYLALEVLAARAGVEGRAELPRPGYDLATRWNAGVHRAVTGCGAVVTGDLAELPAVVDPVRREALPAVPAPASRRDMLDDAELAAAALNRLRRRRLHQLARNGVAVEEPPEADPAALRRAWEASPDPVDAAAVSLAESARQAALLLRRLRRARKGHGVPVRR